MPCIDSGRAGILYPPALAARLLTAKAGIPPREMPAFVIGSFNPTSLHLSFEPQASRRKVPDGGENAALHAVTRDCYGSSVKHYFERERR